MTDTNRPFRPFLVADRPASLRMIRGASLDAFPRRCGIMTHANVSKTVKDFVREFPSSNGFYPLGTTDERKQEYEDENKYVKDSDTNQLTPRGKRIRAETVRICDSGVFTKNGSNFDSYEALFETYEYEMDVDYGIIIDELNDPDATLESAEEALAKYEEQEYEFDLIGVAQGTTLDTYFECYDRLRELGYQHIAIGGLLEAEGDRGGAFANVSNEAYMAKVLTAISEEYEDDWLFALGCHHPARRELFANLGLFGADYKGWIYKYSERNSEGIVSARNWRYRNIRSFIRNNILTGSWLPPKPELNVARPPTKQLVIFVVPDGADKPVTSVTPLLEQLETPAATGYRQFLADAEKATTRIFSTLIYTDATGLVPGDYRLRPDIDIGRRQPENKQEMVELDLQKFFQYRQCDNVLIVGIDRTELDILTPVRMETASDLSIQIATGSPTALREAVEEVLLSVQ